MDQNKKITVEQLVSASLGVDFVIVRSLRGLLRYMVDQDGNGEVLYYGDQYSIPSDLRMAYIWAWSANCAYKDPMYEGAIVIIIC